MRGCIALASPIFEGQPGPHGCGFASGYATCQRCHHVLLEDVSLKSLKSPTPKSWTRSLWPDNFVLLGPQGHGGGHSCPTKALAGGTGHR